MIRPIQLSASEEPFNEICTLNIPNTEPKVELFSEAVFANGRDKLKPIVEIIIKIQ